MPSFGAPHCLAQTNKALPDAFGLRFAYFQVFFEVGVVTEFRKTERGLRAFEFLFSVVDERIAVRGGGCGGKREARGGFYRLDDALVFRGGAITNVS